MTEHTPGPWRVVQTGPHTCDVMNSEGHRIARLAPWVLAGDEEGRGQSLATARLIAAAPVLLEALERALPWLGKAVADNIHKGTVLPNDLPNTLTTATKAVERAT